MNPLALEIRRSIKDPKALADALGLKVEQRGGGYVMVCCPVHAERHASCSIHRRDGTVMVKCWGCEWTGDALSLIAAARGLSLETQFPDVMREGARIAGRWDLEGQVGAPSAKEPREPVKPSLVLPEEPPREYPSGAELAALWGSAGPVSGDMVSAEALRARGIDVEAVDAWGLARALVLRTGLWCQLPEWARCEGRWWPAHGYRMIVPVYDADGVMRSVRAWLTGDGSQLERKVKRRPPMLRKAQGLVLANAAGVELLRGEPRGTKVVIVEGEPDYLVRSTVNPDWPVLGVFSGSWSDEYAERYAARIPYGAEVVIRTHMDKTGNRYAEQILKSIRHRAEVYRVAIDGERESEAA